MHSTFHKFIFHLLVNTLQSVVDPSISSTGEPGKVEIQSFTKNLSNQSTYWDKTITETPVTVRSSFEILEKVCQTSFVGSNVEDSLRRILEE